MNSTKLTNRTLQILLAVVAVTFSLNLLAQQEKEDAKKKILDAAHEGKTEVVQKLLQLDPELLEVRNGRGSTPLIVAASKGHAETVKALLEAGADVDATNTFQNTPLHYAAWSGDKETFIILAKSGADLDAENSRESTIMQYACMGGNIDIVKILEKKGVDIMKLGDKDENLLFWAAHGGDMEVFRYLLDKGLDINVKDDEGSSVLQWAAAGNNTEMLEMLTKKHGMDVNEGDNIDAKPMSAALNWGRLESAQFFIENGVDVNEKFDENMTWIHQVSHSRSPEILELFIKNGADVNAVTDFGGRPLNWAAGSGNLESVKLLIKAGAKINPGICKRKGCDDDGSTPLHNAAWRSPEIIAYLIEKGAYVNAENEDGNTALHSAARGDSSESVVILCKSGAKLNVKNKNGQTPLHFATQKGNPEMVKTLLSFGADASQQDEKGYTPLHYAAISGYSDIAAALVKNSASVNAMDGDGHSPLYYASYYGNKKVAGLLHKNGAEKQGIKKEKSCMLAKSYGSGEAVIWYTGHSGWVVKTKDHVLVFDYWQRGREPDNCCLNNGWIAPEELKNENVYVFVSHSHGDHYDQRIFDWNEKVDNITYVFGFPSTDKRAEINYIEPRNQKKVGDVKVTTLASNDSGEGFIVEVDGVKILHPGDHANKNDEMTDDYKSEIDYFASNYSDVDIAFFPISGCGFRNKTAVYNGVYYAIEKMNPKLVLPMHGLGREYQYEEFAEEAGKKGYDAKYACAANKGDRFFYPSVKISMAE